MGRSVCQSDSVYTSASSLSNVLPYSELLPPGIATRIFHADTTLAQSTTSPSIGSSPNKKEKDAALQSQTPLERLLLRTPGPIRNDGSDKFYGMENFGNSCYANSILQCLFFSVPFREHVLNYPVRSPLETLTTAAATAIPRPSPLTNGAAAKKPLTTQRNLGSPPVTQTQKPEDKDSPEYKKKQALIAGPILNMSYQNTAGYNMPESLFTALKDLFEAVVVNQSRSGVISPTKFLEVLRKENEMFRSAMHQDAHEFLNLLLNTVVENVDAYAKELEAQKEAQPKQNGDIVKMESQTVSFPSFLPPPSNGAPGKTRWVHELFEGTLTSETRCLTCENVSQRDEAFLDLSVDLDQHSSVTSCLRRFSEEEMLCERNKFHCDNCGGLQEAEKRMKIKRLPKILALHLKRFKYTEDLQRLQKLFHKVVYPYHLRLFNTTDDAEDPDRLYELYAVVVHIGGGPYHGHYVAIIKTEDRGWLLFDDEMVEPVDRSYVRNFFGDRAGLACAYVLFYQETTLEAMNDDQVKEGNTHSSAEETVGLGLKSNGTAELHRVNSARTPGSPNDPEKFASLDHAMTAPSFSPDLKIDNPFSPPLAAPATPTTSLSPNMPSKKEKAKEDKERKAAEKEKEKADKQQKKDLEMKMKEMQKKQDNELKAALEASKVSKTEDDKRASTETPNKENGAPNGIALGGLDRFVRSKSMRFSTFGRKDKLPSAFEDDTNGSASAEPLLPERDHAKEKENAKEKEKRNRFSIRKKSFGMLSER